MLDQTNTDLANLFIAIGEQLKIRGANPYRIKAYHRAADTIAALQECVTELAERGELETLPGIGKDLSSKIREFLAVGTMQIYEELKTPLPSEIKSWIRLPGFSEPLVNDLYYRLKIQTLEDLEQLVRSHLLRTRPGISLSTPELLEAIHTLRETDQPSKPALQDHEPSPTSGGNEI